MDDRYNHSSSEAALQRYWLEQNIYGKSNTSNQPIFSIDTPPPTVSGSLHLGHIFSYTQTDIIARYKRMCGFNIYYPFGFDDNGLATERFVEKKCNIRADQLSRKDFIALCLAQTKIAAQEFTALWQRIGLSTDWNFSYSTISPETRKISQASFIDLYHKGFVYRSQEPVLYCTSCRTAIAQAELDDKEVPSTFYDLIFKDHAGNNLIIGTTRPELLFSCVALLYNPHDKRYQHLAQQQAQVPLAHYFVPILADEHVVPEKGTGLVMCCTFGDKTDIEWYKKFKLPYRQSIGNNGKFIENSPLAGLTISEGRAKIVANLAAASCIVKQREIVHTVNIHERCKKEIEFLILSQWFIKVLPYKEQLVKQADAIAWYPPFMKMRYKNWVENMSWDWCISRQRRFGIPFPVWHCSSCNNIIVAHYQDLPIDPQETACPKECPTCKNQALTPDTDVMDTWNTSSITPQLVMSMLNKEANFFDTSRPITPFHPMSMRPQAHDIIRTWAFYTIMKAWMHHQTIPWHTIVISGHVLSAQQEKLSKSRENSSMTPENLLKQYPADAIRYWTASGSLGQDIAFSDAQIRIGHKLITKLWNAFRFVNSHGKAPTHCAENSRGLVNEWIIKELNSCFSIYTHHFSSYEFGHALTEIERFFWHIFCDNYLELIKHQLFNENEYELATIQTTRHTLHQVGFAILQLYAPYVPYVTDTIYRDIFQSHDNNLSIHKTRFVLPYQMYDDTSIMSNIMNIIAQVRKLKTEYRLPLNAPVDVLTIVTDNEYVAQLLPAHEQLIRGITHAKKLWCTFSSQVNSSLIDTDGTTQISIMLTDAAHESRK